MSAAAPSRGIVGLFKRGWNEIPEIVASGILGLVGIGITIYACRKDIQRGPYRPNKLSYTVIRDDDPLAETVRKLNESK